MGNLNTATETSDNLQHIPRIVQEFVFSCDNPTLMIHRLPAAQLHQEGRSELCPAPQKMYLPVCATCPVHLPYFDCPNNTLWRLRIIQVLIRDFLHPPIISSFLGPIFISAGPTLRKMTPWANKPHAPSHKTNFENIYYLDFCHLGCCAV